MNSFSQRISIVCRSYDSISLDKYVTKLLQKVLHDNAYIVGPYPVLTRDNALLNIEDKDGSLQNKRVLHKRLLYIFNTKKDNALASSIELMVRNKGVGVEIKIYT